MNQNPNLQHLLILAAKQLGKSPQQLEQELQSGNLNGLLGGLQPEARQKAQQLIQNPELAKQLLSSKEASELLKKLDQKK
jgi:hypothetical protein